MSTEEAAKFSMYLSMSKEGEYAISDRLHNAIERAETDLERAKANDEEREEGDLGLVRLARAAPKPAHSFMLGLLCLSSDESLGRAESRSVGDAVRPRRRRRAM